MIRHFTATAHIIYDNRALLHFHAKLKKYLPPGGHIEINETPVDAMMREVMEETGLEVEIIEDENILASYDHAKSFARPYLCLLENIPKYKDQNAHQHIDFIYITKPLGNTEPFKPFNWYSLDQIKTLVEKGELFPDVVDVLTKLLSPKEALVN